MKLAIVLMSALTLHSAQAADSDVAMGVAMVAMYDGTCGKVSPQVLEAAKSALATLPRATALGAMAETKAAFARDRAGWCAQAKATITAAGAPR